MSGASEAAISGSAGYRPSGLLGARSLRVEDRRLLTGVGRYIDDVTAEETLHLRLVRSPEPHGVMRGVHVPDDLGRAVVVTADDLDPPHRQVSPRYRPRGVVMPNWPLLAAERVRYVGEPVAAVLDESAYLAEDAAEYVYADIDPLTPVVDPTAPLRGPSVHEAFPDNTLFEIELAHGEPCVGGDDVRTVTRSFRTHRHTGMPLETRGCLAIPEGDRITLWCSSQMPHLLRSMVAEVLGWSEDRVRVRVPDIGGGFGVKGHAYPDEALVAVLAMRTGQPVKWIEDRSENMMASIHARDHRHQLELDIRDDGTILALRADLVIDCGAYPVWPQTAALEAQMAARILPGPYMIENYRCRARAVATNKAPLGTYRGVARPSSVFSLERIVDEAASELGMDPVEVRLRNVVTDFPYRSASGLCYDEGSYYESIARGRDLVKRDVEALKANREIVSGKLRGVGFACFVEQTAHVPPWAQRGSGVVVAPDRVEVSAMEDGRVRVQAGINSHGQGQETTLAQIVAAELGVPLTQVTVSYGDTGSSPYSTGTLASRSAVVAGTAAAEAARNLAAIVREAAAHLALPAEDVNLVSGKLESEAGSMTLAELVTQCPNSVDEAGRPVIRADAIYEGPDGGTYSNACHIAVVDVDQTTGQVEIVRFVVVEDCGRIINPMIVDGQIQGGVAQGIGSALYEELVYDENGQLITTTLMDYRMPSSLEVPSVEIHHLETPSSNILGVKGMGESGAIGPMAAIGNAVADAVGPERGRRVLETPLTPERVWCVLTEDHE